MPFNRELLASVSFDPESSPDEDVDVEREPIDSSPGGEEDVDAAMDAPAKETPDEASRRVVQCLQIALKHSISSSSRLVRPRPLDPKVDFSLVTRLTFTSRRRGWSCCGGAATGVRRARPEGFSRLSWRPSPDRSRRPRAASRDSAPRPPGEAAEERRTSPLGAREPGDETVSPALPSQSESLWDEEDEESVEGPSVGDFVFTDYSALCYRHIRQLLHVDSKEYCAVLCASRWHIIATPGKSAAQLFFCGKDWVIKTMTNEESVFLRGFLRRYYHHVLNNPYTLLPHLVGHHKLECDSGTLNLVIMRNVFATTNTIHEKYDLKGSTIGRFATKTERRQATCTQKDLDVTSPIYVGARRRQLLMDQLQRDCDFLQASHIMDYSLLVGVHILPGTHGGRASPSAGSPLAPPTTPPPLSPRVSASPSFAFGDSGAGGGGGGWGAALGMQGTVRVASTDEPADAPDHRCLRADEGGMLSDEAPGLRREIYYIGIIDILQEYNMRKRLENLTFGMWQDRTRMSCVSPSTYASRFMAFVSSIIV